MTYFYCTFRCAGDNKELTENKQRYILECLKTIDNEDSKRYLKSFAQKAEIKGSALDYAREFSSESEEEKIVTYATATEDIFKSLPKSFRNPFEQSAEYILIPGGSYKFEVKGKSEQVTIPNTYFAKYPVTHKRYRAFIEYLQGKNSETANVLEPDIYKRELEKFAQQVKGGFVEYLKGAPGDLSEKMKTREDDKKFLGDDQPVERVTWFDAQAYCLWLTLLELAAKKGSKDVSLLDAGTFYRLPHEKEWFWAAAGREKDGTLREFPWRKQMGNPTPKLANYDGNVGATTPVGRYPDGATPEGLMDMAGNVWEWQANWYDKDEAAVRSLRGGSWGLNDSALRCSARFSARPDTLWINYIGFRVALCESSFFDTLLL